MQPTLQPPAIHMLSDHVIGPVAQRAWSSRDNFGVENKDAHDMSLNQHHPTPYSPYPLLPNSTTERVTGLSSSKPDFADLSIQRPTAIRLRSKRFKSAGRRRSKDDDISSTQRREHYRCKQQRYRENQRNMVTALEDAIWQLHEEIEQLKRRQDRLTLQEPRHLTIWIVATEYFRIFQSDILTDESMSSNDLEFLHATMSPDALLDSVYGLDAHLENWRLFTQHFPDIHIGLKQLKQIREQSLIADITTTFTISEKSMWHVFPHLFTSGEGTRYARIAARLRGQRLILQGSVRFEWDDEIKQFTCVQINLDMMSAVLQILPDLEDVALMFSKALIDADGKPKTSLSSTGSGAFLPTLRKSKRLV